jgi:PKHD-type hydroxylase
MRCGNDAPDRRRTRCANCHSHGHQTGHGRCDLASGKTTAGWYAKDVKHNDQASGSVASDVMEQAKSALMGNALFLSAARPKTFVRTLISRYRPGMHYGTHVDDALMDGIRTDLSFTLFLASPDSYDGGELVIESADGETDVKLEAGSMVLYPTTSLHRVNAVTTGERLAIVGWVRSFIRSSEQRETLFDLDQVIAKLKSTNADRTLMNPVMKVRNTLVRMWAED